jgi:hypothetical protein
MGYEGRQKLRKVDTAVHVSGYMSGANRHTHNSIHYTGRNPTSIYHCDWTTSVFKCRLFSYLHCQFHPTAWASVQNLWSKIRPYNALRRSWFQMGLTIKINNAVKQEDSLPKPVFFQFTVIINILKVDHQVAV